MGALGDKSHMSFECPATQAAWAPYAHFPGRFMLQFIHHAEAHALDALVHALVFLLKISNPNKVANPAAVVVCRKV